MVTGVVLRAFAAHEEYRRSIVARDAGVLLRDSLFQKDVYPDRASIDYWTKFTYPFWFTDLLSSLDSLSLLGFTGEDPHVKEALRWLTDRQQEDGLWRVKLLKSGGDKNLKLWVSLAICRVFKRL
jgi:hypothetical protein